MLPCLDEAAALPAVLATLPDWPVLVVDNGSTDDTAVVARDRGARVVVEPRRGYGAAVHTGLAHARAELVAVLDGDGSLDVAVLPTLADAVRTGRADLAVGRRVPAGPGCGPGTPARATRSSRPCCAAAVCPCTTSPRSASDVGTPCWAWVSPTARSATRWSC